MRILLLAGAILIVSCSSSKQTATNPVTEKNTPTHEQPTSNDTTFILLQESPRIVGGMQSVQRKLQYPEEAIKRNLQGRVTVSVYVESDGSLDEMTIVRSPHPLLSRAAKRAIRKVKFIPGKKNGQAGAGSYSDTGSLQTSMKIYSTNYYVRSFTNKNSACHC